jgi:Golgi apparatus protein 1
MDAMSLKPGQMSASCKTKLEERNKLWKTAHDEYTMELPETWGELYDVIAHHPHRWSFLTYIGAFLLIILFVGCCCGRMTKRVHRELKNR